jgi:hypothetical protein
MKVNYVKTNGFRKFKGIFETDLYDITNITGKNRSGKSNVLYAIINIMLGTNLSGDEKACLINKNCDESYGELHFTDNNGIKHTLIRGKNKYSSKGNFLALDGKPITQAELISFYKDKKLFLSIINPLYFLNKKPAEQKEMVDKYLSDIRPKVIFDRLDNQNQDMLINKYYHNKEKKYDELTAKEQEEFINFNMFNICMDIAYNNLSKQEQNILEGVPSDIPSYISELNADIKKTENLISSLDGKIEYAQNIVNEKIPEYKTFEKDEELSLAEQELSHLNTNAKIVDKENQKKVVEELEKDILSKETEFNELDTSMKTGKKKYLSIKNGETCTCPTCNQHIQNESKSITIKNMHNELIAMYDKRNLLETQIKDLKFKLSVERCKYHALEGNPIIEKEKRIAVVEQTIKQLETEKQEIQKFNHEIAIKEKTINGAKSDINKFTADKQTKIKFIDTLNEAKKVAQKLYIAYIEEKMKLAKEYLKDVDIKFYSVLKTTGEIKEDFIITYKNNPLSDLSRSETIATALEFANMFNKISRANIPIFIDDYESCADYDFINEYSKDTQVILSKVEKGHLLKIADANSDNCTIIKPVIKDFKTIKIYKNINNAVEIPEAA